MLRFLSKLCGAGGPGSDESDRRCSPRYPVVQNRGQITWMEEGEYLKCGLCVLNISQGGIEVMTEKALRLKGQVWIHLEAPAPTDWVEGWVVRIKRRRVYGLKFSAACPYSLFKAATHGKTLDEAGIYENAPEFDRIYWR